MIIKKTLRHILTLKETVFYKICWQEDIKYEGGS